MFRASPWAPDPFSDPVRIKSPVAEDDATVCKAGQQHYRAMGVMNLTAGQHQLDG